MGKGRHTIKVNKRGRKGQGGRHNKKRKTDEAGWDIEEGKGKRGNWAPSERKNDLFVEYYRNTFGFSDAEWTEFSDSLTRDLPTTFRITAHSYFAAALREKLTTYFQPKLHNVDVGSELLPNIMQFEPLSWYPNGNGWYVRTPRRALKKVDALTQFNQFLVNETEVGHTSRQEAVSMIPPIFLKVENHHKVLDMCAAPGSKTTQLIEYLHQGLEHGQIPSGMVVANDVDEQRCYMLVHQVKRIGSPCVMMANYAAQLFPAIRPKLEDGSRSEVTFFDRILADVPCSGDGTLRKNFDLWGKWHPGLGTALHMLQLRIATRAARLLKIGGRMVYSTCSFNPVEDEAVVAELIRRGQGALEVVDMSNELPGLKRSPGITSWKVYDLVHKDRDTKEKEYKWYTDHSELPERRQGSIPATCFPPTADEVESLHLERCVRVFPHQQDTGGFFITVIQKVGEMPPVPDEEEVLKKKHKRKAANANTAANTAAGTAAAATEEAADADKGKEKEAETKADDAACMELEKQEQEEKEEEEEEEEDAEADDGDLAEQVEEEGKDAAAAAAASKGKDTRRRRHNQGNREEPYLPLSAGLTVEWELVKEYFGVKESFPEQQLMARGEGSPRIYFLSSAVSNVLWRNSSRFSKVVNTGIRMLVKHAPPDAKCHYRPCQEGIEWLYPYMTKRLVTVSFDDMAKLILEDTPFMTSFTPETQAQLEPLDPGCCVFVCHVAGHATPLLACGWKARTSAHLLVDKHVRKSWSFLFSLKPAETTAVAGEATTTESAESSSVTATEVGPTGLTNG